MPNGRPGDHPYTDIVVHGGDVYSPEIDEIVRSVDEYGEFSAKRRARSLLWEAEYNPSEEELEALAEALRALEAAIEAAERYDAESPLAACLADESGVYDADLRALVRDVHDRIEAEVDNTRRGRAVFGALLWKWGWEPDDADAFEAEIREFPETHWVMDK